MATKRFGKLAARYSFALNSDGNSRFSKCPKCGKLMHPRKFPLLIHVDDSGLIVLGKTCRYCSRCDLIIAHQQELEAELANSFSTRAPAVIGNPYFVIGTVDRTIWTRGLRNSSAVRDIEDQTADFKHYLDVWVEPGGWVPTKTHARK